MGVALGDYLQLLPRCQTPTGTPPDRCWVFPLFVELFGVPCRCCCCERWVTRLLLLTRWWANDAFVVALPDSLTRARCRVVTLLRYPVGVRWYPLPPRCCYDLTRCLIDPELGRFNLLPPCSVIVRWRTVVDERPCNYRYRLYTFRRCWTDVAVLGCCLW